MFIDLIICLFAGLGAGLGTGFAGMSAAAVISPMLITFLGMDAYEAVGIALASDVLASAVSALTYGKKKNIDLKDGGVMLAAILVFTLVGSIVADLIPSRTMGSISVFVTFFLGLRFLIKPIMTTKENMEGMPSKRRLILSLLSGIGIGFICGFVGAGGGIMMLICLTSLLGYELKTAVGTSVFIMTFTALTGAVSHFVIGGVSDIPILLFCVIFTFLFARLAARIANYVDAARLNRITGIVLSALGIAMIVMHYS